MVKLKIAEALAGKQIILVPSGASGSAFNKMDVNKLIDTFKDEPASEDLDEVAAGFVFKPLRRRGPRGACFGAPSS